MTTPTPAPPWSSSSTVAPGAKAPISCAPSCPTTRVWLGRASLFPAGWRHRCGRAGHAQRSGQCGGNLARGHHCRPDAHRGADRRDLPRLAHGRRRGERARSSTKPGAVSPTRCRKPIAATPSWSSPVCTPSGSPSTASSAPPSSRWCCARRSRSDPSSTTAWSSSQAAAAGRCTKGTSGCAM